MQRLIEAIRAQMQTPLVAGNRAALLVDGPQTLGAIRRAIENARDHVHVETYIFADDEVGRDFRDLLLLRRREGVEVRVIYDAVGSRETPAAFFETLTRGAVEVRAFRPLDPVRTPRIWRTNNRDHRKLVIIDGRTAFTGGVNISSAYARSSAAKSGAETGEENGWRDTHVQIDGPVAAQFQALFLDTWNRAGESPPTTTQESSADRYYPATKPAGTDLAAAAAGTGGDRERSAIYSTYIAAVRYASKRLWMTQAYFAPNKELRRELIDAARRGVDVRLIAPGFTDSSLIFYASRATYEELLAGGVRIYEQRDALLHAKTLVVDGAASMVGSANFDMRSFLHNNEVNAVVVGSDFARRLEEVFEHDLASVHEINLQQWRKRSVFEKLKEFGAGLFSYWL
ncbi:MAG TPA: phospholipase D-like domain-containing protein [Steroidobacter sp.]|nr:phospholipase D-like domain-containing protein [Steroidobacter sp.]